MQVQLTLVGAQPDEQTPDVALYAIDARGQASKLATASNGKLDISGEVARSKHRIVAFGPDVEDPKSLDSGSLLQLRLADQLPLWKKQQAIEIPSQLWRLWLYYTICLSGRASKCYPFIFDKLPLLRDLALGQLPYRPFERCLPICNGVVEVWESNCCCFPFLLSEVPTLISRLQQFLAQNPVMFPQPRPGPDPGPVESALSLRVNRALSAGKTNLRFVPSTQMQQHLLALQAATPQDAVEYFANNPSLWPIWCHCTTTKLGETGLNPDGSFNYCFRQFPFYLINCRRSYFYKVKQQQGQQWTYIYDGAAAHQYFAADELANLSTFLGNACGSMYPPPDGIDFVTLQQIGSTPSYELHSNYVAASASNADQVQTGAYSVAAPPSNGGLVGSNNAPWCTALSFMLYFDPGMQALGAAYYRVSWAPADLNGNPVGGMQTIVNSVTWSKYVIVGSNVEVQPQALGPNNVGGVGGLFTIPYNADADWLGGQFHQSLDTAQLHLSPSGTPGPGNGRFLLAVEVFDSSGKRLVPVGVTPGAGDATPTGFRFLRWMPDGVSQANVIQPALTHLFWADNRQVAAEIDNFTLGGITGAEECQFLSGPGTDSLQIGYRAYHAVLGDAAPPNTQNPLPPSTFMSGYSLWWERGLNGGSGTFDSGNDTDQPLTRDGGPPQQSPAANGLLSNLLPQPGPTACSFAVTLHVVGKHTNGSGHPTQFDKDVVAALALSLT